MALTILQAEEIASALAGAFDRRDLAGLAHADAGVTVTLADDDTAADYAIKLVWQAEKQQRLDWLILAALRLRPDNGPLSQIIGSALSSSFATEQKKTVGLP